MTRPTTSQALRRALHRASLAALAALCSACTPGPHAPSSGAPDAGPPGEVPDTTPPATKALPSGGTYSAVQYVRLVSDELATIHHTVDGAAPVEGAPSTVSGENPVFWIRVGPGTTTLKFFGVDAAGNREAVRTETYVVALAPVVTIDPPAAVAALLGPATFRWESDRDGTYVVEVGGSGVPGSGTQLASGDVRAGSPMTLAVTAGQLGDRRRVWVHVTAADGSRGKASALVESKMVTPHGTASNYGVVAVLPTGQKAYGLGASLEAVDADPSSAGYGGVVKDIPLPDYWESMALSPDGKFLCVTYATYDFYNRVYVPYLYVFSTETDTRVASVTLTPGALSPPGAVAVTVDGKRAYVLTASYATLVVDVDPASATAYQVIATVPFSAPAGEIAMTSDGKRAVVSWQQSWSHAVALIDVDPASPTYHTVLPDWPLPTMQTSSSGYGLALSPDGRFAYVSELSTRCGLCKVDLVANRVTAQDQTFSPWSGTHLALTHDGRYLLVTSGGDLLAYDAAALTFAGRAQVAPTGHQLSGIAVASGDLRVYVIDQDYGQSYPNSRRLALLDLY